MFLSFLPRPCCVSSRPRACSRLHLLEQVERQMRIDQVLEGEVLLDLGETRRLPLVGDDPPYEPVEPLRDVNLYDFAVSAVPVAAFAKPASFLRLEEAELEKKLLKFSTQHSASQPSQTL